MKQTRVECRNPREREQDGTKGSVRIGKAGGGTEDGGRGVSILTSTRDALPEQRDVSRLVSGTLMPPAGSRERARMSRAKSVSRKYLCAPMAHRWCFFVQGGFCYIGAQFTSS